MTPQKPLRVDHPGKEWQHVANLVLNGRFQIVRNAGHYLQEDAGGEIAERMVTFLTDEANVISM